MIHQVQAAQKLHQVQTAKKLVLTFYIDRMAQPPLADSPQWDLSFGGKMRKLRPVSQFDLAEE